MGPMTTEPTYGRPVPATMIVRLANGEESEARPEDFAKFGYADRNTVPSYWRAFVEDAVGSDLLSADSVLNPLWLVLHQALINPASLSDGSMRNAEAGIHDLDRIIRDHKVAEAAF